MNERQHKAVKRKVLVMEEEPSIRNMMEKMLAKKGFEVVCAKDGAEAIGLYQTAHAMQHPFDAVILDLNVSIGMGGTETIKQLMVIDPDVKGIVSSGYLFDDIIANPCKYGFCGAITKPFSLSKLVSTINNVIDNGNILSAEKYR